MKRLLISAVLCLININLVHSESINKPFSLDGSIFETIGKKYELDPILLYAVALTESANGIGDGYIQPHPYVFRTKNGPRYFQSKKEAEVELASVIRHTAHVDVGMMQINLHYHPQDNPLALLDPVHNLTVAAQYLKQTIASTSDPVIGVGRYHSWTKILSKWYGERVWQTYRNLIEIKAYN